jgi:serine phosphatase RsbU (regulator of sigma subunit)
MARLADRAFLLFFALYLAGSVVWLLSGVPPVVAAHSRSVHRTLHKWGASHQAYVVATKQGLEQKATATSRAVPAKELGFRAGGDVTIYFKNDEPDILHNFAVYRDDKFVQRLYRGPAATNKVFVAFRFPTPAPGDYYFRDDFHPASHGKVVVAEAASRLPAWARWLPDVRTMATGAALDSHVTKPLPEVVLIYLFSLLNIGLGVLLVLLRPRDLAARLLAIGMVGTAALFNFQAHSALEEMPRLAAALHDNYHVATGLAYIYALLVFPDGKLVPRWSGPRWFRWPLRVVYLTAVTAVVFFNRGRLHGDPGGFVLLFGVLIPVAGVTSQAFRLREATSATEREQSRVLIWTLGMALAVALALGGLKLVIDGAHLHSQTLDQLNNLAFLVFPVLFAVIPITLTVVLVRYRLWEMDRVINQTLVYGTLTGVLGLAYIAIVLLLRSLLDPFTGRSGLAIAGSTLAVAALFRPVRDRLQAFIDRRFYRSRYDAVKTLETFSERVRDEIDLDTVTGELLAAAEETMQPARMSLWLRPGDGAAGSVEVAPGAARQPAGGTVAQAAPGAVPGAGMAAFLRSAGRGARRALGRGEPGPPDQPASQRLRRTEVVPVRIDRDDPIVARLQAGDGPVALEQLDPATPASEALRAAGMRLVVPLVSQGEPIGLLGLGRRLSERDYSSDDRKLLDDLAKRAAPPLRVAQLVRELVRQQAAELRARERIEQELRVAQLIQQQFLPRELPELPGWQVAAYYQPAHAVGGDFYDFIELPDGQLGVVCGDVTDKGVPAALVMATTHSILRGDAARLLSPGKVLERANELLRAEIPPTMFVTCLYGVLDPATGRLRYANAGHNAPYVHTADGVVELRATGMPLGLMEAMTYEEKETTLGPGDSLLLHSDGLVEAHGPEREMFGFPRLAALVGECPSGQELIDRLLRELDGFTGPGWEQEDDITLVTIDRASPSTVPGARPAAQSVAASPASVPSSLASS